MLFTRMERCGLEWAVGEIGIVKHAWICVYARVNVRYGKGREEIKFGNEVNEDWRIIIMGEGKC